ncbi:MAG: glycosyltransferase family 4 protein [Chloroflexi bacterium]|nr:glycosyltransferase family 4 protein [Chloroflexota bacterium]
MIAPTLRVLFVGHTYIVGVNQAKLGAIAATGAVDVGLLVPSKWYAPEWRRQVDLERPYPRIHLFAKPVWFEGRSGAYLCPPWEIARTLANFQPDLIQVEQEVFALSTFEMALFARLTGKPLVVFCWENVDRHLSMFRQWTRWFVLRTASLIIAGSHGAADLLSKWGYTGPIEIMPQLGVDTNLFAPRPRIRSNGDFIVGFVGRLVHQKGVDLLLTATRLLKDRGHRCRVVICGTGPDEKALRREAERLGIADNVTWRSAVQHNEVPDEMSLFDALVLPSRSIPNWKEQFGHVLIEAMSMGIPAVGSTCGEIPYVIGRRDLVFPEGEAEGLAALLERMINEKEWHDEIRQYCLARVDEHFTHERIATKLLRLWHQLMTKSARMTAQRGRCA